MASAKNSKTPIWDTLKASYPYGAMPQEKIECVEETVEKLLETGPHAEEPGLLLGKIQCGKTDTFEDIIGLAFDKGIDVAIVITKGTKALVNQTIRRMNKDYRFFRVTDSLEQHTTINIYNIMDLWCNLRQAKVESGKTVIVSKKNAVNNDKGEPNAIFVGYDKHIKPCASKKIKASNALTLKPQQRFLSVGFWTGTKNDISKTVDKIDKMIVESAHYNDKDIYGFFEIDKRTVTELLRLIESTYIYDQKFHNTDRKNDITEMLCALEYCTAKSNGKVFA